MENKHLLHTYQKFPVTFSHGKGAYLYDTNGKKYLDFAAGIAVSSLGYGNEEFNDTLKGQIDKLVHTSNLYHNETCGKAAEDLAKASEMEAIFFCNSGAEAIEGSLKAARKYAHLKQNGRFAFIAMQDSFHGRSLGALSVTGREAYRAPFEPLLPKVSFAKYNNLESVKQLISEDVCAIILEPLQGEGGIHLGEVAFLQGVRKLCDENDILLIFDEIQCGMGRSGSMFLWQQLGVKPDILAMAKAIGNGLPVGAFGVAKKVKEHSLVPGDHGTTYGGNPLVCAAVSKTIEIFDKQGLVENARKVGAYLTTELEKIVTEFDCVQERRGLALIQGLAFNVETGPIIAKALEEGLLIIGAGNHVIRMVPPLVITNEQVEEMIEKLRIVLTYEESRKHHGGKSVNPIP